VAVTRTDDEPPAEAAEGDHMSETRRSIVAALLSIALVLAIVAVFAAGAVAQGNSVT
jgi:hypothetical protein